MREHMHVPAHDDEHTHVPAWNEPSRDSQGYAMIAGKRGLSTSETQYLLRRASEEDADS